jgi:hypothetical protein
LPRAKKSRAARGRPLLLRLSLLLLPNVRYREQRSSLPEVASLPPMFLYLRSSHN